MVPRMSCLIFLIIAMLCSCAQDQGEKYFPVPSQGTQWDYSVEYLTPSGAQKGNLSIRIEGNELINGKQYYKQLTLIPGEPDAKPQISYNRRTKEGIYKIEGKHKDKPEYLSTPFPISVGSTWTVQTPEGARHYKAESTDTIKIANREYKDCLKVTFIGQKGSMAFNGTSYLAPGIGEVKSILNIGEVTIIYSLSKYKS
jgi:hypothetical protein